jgi:hypothetical protein
LVKPTGGENNIDADLSYNAKCWFSIVW